MTKSDGSELRIWFINNLGADDYIDGPIMETSDPVPVVEELIYLAEKQAREKAESELEERRIATPTMNVVHALQAECESLKERLRSAVFSRTAHMAECDSLKDSMILAKKQRDEFNVKCNSLEAEVACLRSVLSEDIWDDQRLDSFVQWHRANELAEEREK